MRDRRAEVRARQAARAGNAILATTHDLTLAARFADRVFVMDRGRIVAEGPPGEALSQERLSSVFDVVAEMIDLAGVRVPMPVRPR